jgi:hypothetical protein
MLHNMVRFLLFFAAAAGAEAAQSRSDPQDRSLQERHFSAPDPWDATNRKYSVCYVHTQSVAPLRNNVLTARVS